MEIHIQQKNKHLHFQARNANGNTIDFGSAGNKDGVQRGMTPMEALLSSVAACSSFDVVLILKKQRQAVQDVKIKVQGERVEEDQVKPFKNMHIHFILTGIIKEKKAQQATNLAVEKYCSVAASLDPGIKITHSFEINNITNS